MFDPINLDALSIDPADLDNAAIVFDKLRQYASNKATAMRYRMAGEIGPAMHRERLCERIYNELPEWARW